MAPARSLRLLALCASLVLAACGSGVVGERRRRARRAKGPSRSAMSSSSRAAPRSSRSCPAGSPPTRCRRSGRRSRASSSAGCSAKARSSARARRSTRSIPASITPRPRRRRPTCKARAPAPKPRGLGPRATSRWREMEAISKQDYTDALAQARQADARSRRIRRGAAQRADQPALHPRAGPDHRPDRPVGVHRRRAGHRQPGRAAGDHHAARPGLCRHPAVGGGPAWRCGRRLTQGGAVPTSAQVRLKLPDGAADGSGSPGRFLALARC